MTQEERAFFARMRRSLGDPIRPRLRMALCWDQREGVAHAVAVRSIAQTSPRVLVSTVDLQSLVAKGVYTRPTDRREGRLWDVISDAPMSTEHAIARFFVPSLFRFSGWVLSADADILVRADLEELFALADDRYAVMVVKHDQRPSETEKMDGQIQTVYPRKNWSSVMLWNCAHPAHLVLRPEPMGILNRWPGRDLHAFGWLRDEEVGSLPAAWNHLVGVSPSTDVKLAHFTLGTPDMPGYEQSPMADEWWALARREVA